MPVADELLRPIPGDNPSGANLIPHRAVSGGTGGAALQDDTGPQGLWEHEIKLADYDAVVRLTSNALATQTKDLFLACWLAEALLNKRGFAGLNDGLSLISGLIEKFWDTLYPELEDGDAEFRASPLDWFGNYLEPSKGSSPALAVKTVPVAVDKLNWLRYIESRGIPTQDETAGDDGKRAAREKALAEGKLRAGVPAGRLD